jgi:hypothetical protein
MSSLHDQFYEYKNNNEKRKKRPIGRVVKRKINSKAYFTKEE